MNQPVAGEVWAHPRAGFVRILEVSSHAEQALIQGIHVGARKRWRALSDFGAEAGAIQPFVTRDKSDDLVSNTGDVK